MRLKFRAISDEADVGALPAIFREYWPAYRKWIHRSRTMDAGLCVRRLREHMPELMPTFERLVGRLEGGDEVARFLALYDPPRVIRACSQLVLSDKHGPMLIRSYDHHPRLFDGVVLGSCWNGTATLGIADCVWGALDGMNDHGCVVALAFGGRNVEGSGFAAPLVLRYLLEVCESVRDVRAALSRLPVYMPYTFVAVDRSGEFVTAYMSPDRPPSFVTRRTSTNHQGEVEWADYACHTQSVERLRTVECLVGAEDGVEAARRAFLHPPLWRTNYSVGSGTLYVAEYAPAAGFLTLRWPGREEVFGLGDSTCREFAVELPSAVSREACEEEGRE